MTWEDVSALLGESGTIVTDNARWHRRVYTPREIVDTFGMPPVIHPAWYSGGLWVPKGERMPPYFAYVGYESLEVSMEKKSLLCKFKVRHGWERDEMIVTS